MKLIGNMERKCARRGPRPTGVDVFVLLLVLMYCYMVGYGLVKGLQVISMNLGLD